MGQFWVKTIALSGSILNDRQQSRLPSVNQPVPATPAFLPVSFSDHHTPKSDARMIEIEVHQGNSMVKVKWPVQSSSSCLTWLRELTK